MAVFAELIFKNLLLNKSSSGWYYSNIQIQDISESSCGYYCIAFIHEKVKNKNSYITFLNKFVNNRIDNEKDLYNILYTYNKFFFTFLILLPS